MSDQPPDRPRAGLRHRLYHGETNFDFVGRSRVWFAVSAVVIVAGILSMVVQGLNYGIDFKGGTSWEVPVQGISVGEARDALGPLGLGDAKIQLRRSGDSERIYVQAGIENPETQAKVRSRLAELAKVEAGQVSVKDVGPSWGAAVTKKARNALIVFFVLISAYISLRFEWKMAAAALAAVVHDILVTVGVYSLSRFEVTPATVVAFLTILGYSLYDTIVVFDKVEENARGLSAQRRMTYSDTVNLSMNQVLMRSINTSLVAILPVVSLLVVGAGLLGAVTLKDFGLALLIGLLTGAYSSIFIASPILAKLKEQEPQYASIRQRVQSKGGGSGLLTPAAAAMAAGTARAADGGGSRPRGRRSSGDDGEVIVPTATDGVPGPSAGAATAQRPTPASPRKVRPSGGARPAPRPRKKGRKR